MSMFKNKAYSVFLDIGRDKHKLLSEVIIDKLKHHNPKITKESVFTFIDIGSGRGELASNIIRHISNNVTMSKQLRAVLIEDNPVMFESLVRNNGSSIRSFPITCWLINEKYRLDNFKQFKSKCDFVLASHVFYYLSDWPTKYLQMRTLLNKNGLLCIVLKSCDTYLYSLRDKLSWPNSAKKYLERPLFAENFRDMLDTDHHYTCQDIEYELKLPMDAWDSYNGISISRLFSFLYGVPESSWSKSTVSQLKSELEGISINGVAKMKYKETIFWFSRDP